MKKVKLKTECGEEMSFYVRQDVESITVDEQEWVKKRDENYKDVSALDLEDTYDFRELAEKLEKLYRFVPHWGIDVSCDEGEETIKINTCGSSIWQYIK